MNMRDALKKRDNFLAQIRQFFSQRDVVEVQTPQLLDTPVADAYIDSITMQVNKDIEQKSKYNKTDYWFKLLDIKNVLIKKLKLELEESNSIIIKLKNNKDIYKINEHQEEEYEEEEDEEEEEEDEEEKREEKAATGGEEEEEEEEEEEKAATGGEVEEEEDDDDEEEDEKVAATSEEEDKAEPAEDEKVVKDKEENDEEEKEEKIVGKRKKTMLREN